jgi:predicted permease
MDRVIQDVRFAIRLLSKDRAFTATTVATLALCVAANAAIFAVVNAVVLKPLPFPEPHRLAAVFNSYPGAGAIKAGNGVPDYYDRLAHVPAFERLANYRSAGVTIGGAGADVERITSMQATPSLFPLLGASPLRGRLFTDDEAEVGQERKVVLSFGLWQRVFGGRDSAVGDTLRINGLSYTVIGVMPEGFRFVDPDVQLWTPVAYTPQERADDRRHSNNWQQIGRLRAEATIDQAQAQIDALNAANLEKFPQFKTVLTNVGFHTRTVPLQADLVEHASRTLYLLWGGVLAVLLIGCVNVANLVSVRATTRARELATRHALGASVPRLMRQLLTETLLMATVGGAVGLGLGAWALSAADTLGLAALPRGEDIAIDARSVGFTLALIIVVAALVGLFPVLALRRANPAEVIREEGRSGTPSRRAVLVRRSLVTSQVAFALILLVGAGLLVASFQRVLAIDPGFDPVRVMTGTISLPSTRYADRSAVVTATDRIVERVRALPGVLGAGLTQTLPVAGDHNDSVIIADGYEMAPGESLISPNQVRVGRGYFEAMRTELKEGRYFDARDTAEGPRSIIVDEQLARRFWSDQNAVGRLMYFPDVGPGGLTAPARDEWMTVVGVVENVRLDGLVDRPGFRTVGAYYLPFDQSFTRTVTLVVRTAQDPILLTSAIRQEIAAVDPELPWYGVRTMEEHLDRSLVDRRTPMVLALGFGAVALLLAAVGIYGTLAYQVSQRRREIGIRLALGAAQGSIFAMVLREGAAMVGVGLLVGFAGTAALGRALQSQLYEVATTDPRVIASVAAVLTAVALAACLLPARRASRTDPVVALVE